MYSSDVADVSMDSSLLGGLSLQQRQRLTEVLDEYLSALEGGVPTSREDVLRANPDLAEPLGAYLDSLEDLHNAAAGFAGGTDRSEAETEPESNDEKRLGDFRLLREIGRGGMGVVYEAQQISLGRRVALKVLPFAAVLDSKQIARFKNEAQAAAQLDHPNIVSVYAVGSDRGVHYYAMQLIDGQPLDRAVEDLRKTSLSGQACVETTAGSPDTVDDAQDLEDAYRAANHSFLTQLSTDKGRYFRAVMRLGIQAAEALQAAHEFGVIHRDIKPSNLLLDGEGKLWVTDFGLARCQSEKALTCTGDLIGTMRYMSPEQTRGQSALVDQRTDVYSLGATLYELLTLEPAFPGDDGPELLRRLAEQDPRPLKQLQPKVPTDLQTVIHKAMARRREERYTTAQELADDLRRVLEGKPTVAKPPTVADRLAKWTRRHQGLVIAVATVFVLAAVGLASATVLIAGEKVRAEQNAQKADRNFRNAQDTVEYLLKIGDRLAKVPGADKVREELFGGALKYYQRFAEEAKDDPSLRADLALTHSKIGSLADKVGSTDEAIAAHEDAVGLFRQLADDDPDSVDYQSKLALCENNLALVLARVGRTEEARQAYEKAIRIQADLAARSDSDRQFLGSLADFHMNLGKLQNETGDRVKAESSLLEAIRLQERLLEDDPDNAENLRGLAASYNNLGAIYVGTNPGRAIELYEKALQPQKKAAEVRPENLDYLGELALTHNNIGTQLLKAGKFSDAAHFFRQATQIQEDLVRKAPAQNVYRQNLAVSYNNLGLAEGQINQFGQLKKADLSFARALELLELLRDHNPNDIDLCSRLGGTYSNRGVVLEGLKKYDEAGQCLREAIARQQFAHNQAPQVTRYRDYLSQHYFHYGRVLRQEGKAEEAIERALERRELWRGHPNHLFTVAEELGEAGSLLADSPASSDSLHQCQDLVLETLQLAVDAGYRLPRDLRQRKSFAILRHRPELTDLITD